ncbi:MAG: tripartite tricarboxylate transporter substrate binding protein [Armatimonadota bacterium]|nr:tripartite tricarboxylate transporter substrate binding protein [Armatimonadota bacterium]MDR7452764.1 tripartite tricarboxylate transporter substrate binding protein [Armatimonadota bacterium]MDR7468381.1 tripartite tricarboxylate transporter substrate binding protein [Armatimonadota bacterium]MDR7494584.1 tripartite tricarboxylate transporter substrate binding protein [Armatimonadota bacterium]MDR7505939.1 tripartite tricarboxylate transporter substrate binding protein [Armatimonadota bact
MRAAALCLVVLLLLFALPASSAPTFTPRRPIEWTIPAGTGGGADQQARFMAPLIAKYNLSPQPFIPVNRPAGAGAQAFLWMIDRAGDPHTILITLDNLFATPEAQLIRRRDGGRFTWRDLTPIARLLLDNFVLTVHNDSPWKTVADFERAAKAAPRGSIKMSGTGSKQEDEIIMVLLEQAWGVDFTYVPFPGGGAVAAAVVGKQTDFSVNNPLEMVGHWEGGRLRPLAIFASERVQTPRWKDVPTMKELGFPIEYQMLRGIFGTANMPPEAVAFYRDIFQRLLDTPEMADFIERGAFTKAWLTGPAFVQWLEQKDATVRSLMKKGGLSAP